MLQVLLEADNLENALHTCACKALILLTDALVFVNGAIIDLIGRPQDLERKWCCNSDVVPLPEDIRVGILVNVAGYSIEPSMDKFFRDAELQSPICFNGSYFSASGHATMMGNGKAVGVLKWDCT